LRSSEAMKDKYVELGCIVIKHKVLWWVLWILIGAFFLIAFPIIIAQLHLTQ
jgi:endoglucanase